MGYYTLYLQKHQVNRMMAKIEKEFNRLDILVHNASNFNKCPFMEVTEEIWESSFGVNLKGPFFVSQAVAKLMQSLAITLSPNIQCNAFVQQLYIQPNPKRINLNLLLKMQNFRKISL